MKYFYFLLIFHSKMLIKIIFIIILDLKLSLINLNKKRFSKLRFYG